MTISETQIRSPKTEEQYANRYAQLRRQTVAALGLKKEISVSPIQIVDYLIEKKPGYAKRTWQLYKSALRFQFEKSPEDPDCACALETLAREKQTNALTRGTRTSALKAKHFSYGDYQTIMAYIKARIGQNPLAEAMYLWCQMTMLIGLRPSEWEGVEYHFNDDSSVIQKLVIENAKASHGRGNGMTRTIALEKFQADDMKVLEDVMELFPSLLTEISYPKLQERLRKYFSRVARQCLSKRKKYPSLYTFRHQFAANAKAHLTQAEVAALMGHGSDATAGRHYARAARAFGTIKAQPVAAEVARVRHRAQSFTPNSQPNRGRP